MRLRLFVYALPLALASLAMAQATVGGADPGAAGATVENVPVVAGGAGGPVLNEEEAMAAFSARLTPEGVTSTAEGQAIVTVSADGTRISVFLVLTPMPQSAVRSVAIETGQAGQAARQVVLPASGLFGIPRAPAFHMRGAVAAGDVAGGAQTINDTVNALMAGNAQLVVNTVDNPQGELRGKLQEGAQGEAETELAVINGNFLDVRGSYAMTPEQAAGAKATVDVGGAVGAVPAKMDEKGNAFARIPLPAGMAAGQTVKMKIDVPGRAPIEKDIPVTDGIEARAVHDLKTNRLIVVGKSLDKAAKHALTVEGMGEMTKGVMVKDNVMVPPETVTVNSAGGGMLTVPVKVAGMADAAANDAAADAGAVDAPGAVKGAGAVGAAGAAKGAAGAVDAAGVVNGAAGAAILNDPPPQVGQARNAAGLNNAAGGAGAVGTGAVVPQAGPGAAATVAPGAAAAAIAAPGAAATTGAPGAANVADANAAGLNAVGAAGIGEVNAAGAAAAVNAPNVPAANAGTLGADPLADKTGLVGQGVIEDNVDNELEDDVIVDGVKVKLFDRRRGAEAPENPGGPVHNVPLGPGGAEVIVPAPGANAGGV